MFTSILAIFIISMIALITAIVLTVYIARLYIKTVQMQERIEAQKPALQKDLELMQFGRDAKREECV